MDAADPFGGQRFALRAGKRDAKHAVVVRADHLQIEHPMLKEPLQIPLALIGRAVHLTELVQDDTIYRGSPRGMGFGPPSVDPNVALALDRSITVPKFKLGAEQTLAITKRERRRGVTIDDVALRVDDPAALVAALEARGVQVAGSAPEAMRAVHGLAAPAEAAAIRARRQRTVRKGRAMMAFWALAILLAGSLRLHAHDDTSEMVDHTARQSLVALALVAVVAIVALLVPLRPRSSRREVGAMPSSMEAARPMVAVLVAMGALLAFAVVGRRMGITPFLAYAPIIAAPAAGLAWIGIRAWQRQREDDIEPPDGTAEGRDRGSAVLAERVDPPSPYRR